MYIDKRFIIVSCILVFALSPLAAIVLSNATQQEEVLSTNIEPATKSDLLTAAKQANEDASASEKFDDIAEITSVQRMENWWYVATVKIATTEDSYNPGPQGMLFAKFTNEPNSIYVVTKPGESFNHYNISGNSGVPYSVIDRLNEVNNAGE